MKTILTLFSFFGILLWPAVAAEFVTDIKPFLEKHCMSCHGPDKQKGRLRLDTLTDDFNQTRTASTWIEVRDNLNLGEMPPEDEPRPEAAELLAVSTWIADQLKAMHAQANSTGGKALLRRLSRPEYLNTVRDLLKVRFEEGEGPLEILPPDGSLEGFNKVSKALLLDPSLMDNYFDAASFVANRAVTTRPPRVQTWKDRFEFEDTPKTQGISYVAANRATIVTTNGMHVMRENARTAGFPKHPYNDKSIPVIGRYKVRVKAGAFVGERKDPLFMEVRWATQKKRFRVDHTIDEPGIYEWEVAIDVPPFVEFEVYLVNDTRFDLINRDSSDMHQEITRLVNAGNVRESLRVRQEGGAEGIYTGYYHPEPTPISRDLTKIPKLFLDYIEVEGPLQEAFPPASTRYLYPDGHDAAETQTLENVRRIFTRLLPRAFRRPVTRSEINAQVAIVAAELERGTSFHAAMKVGLTAMLCAPDFLFLHEPSTGAISEFELATRLSYFLWSSMPDDELFGLAQAGRLRTSLDAQITRMLADPKAEALVEDFAEQWLKVSEFTRFRPDQGIYNEFYASEFSGMEEYVATEARAFFREVLMKNESVLNFLDSEWIMANEKLAKFYGIDGVEGEAFRRVALPADSPRGGIMGMAGVHIWGADGARTKPVERGKYLLSVLFNDPPDPPPPNAGEVEPNIQGQRLTVRERLIRHQEIEACAGCHKTIDPYGLAFENFNAIGRWREVQDGESRRFWDWQPPAINASGTLPNGQAFADFAAFKTLLNSQSKRFERGLAEKMFIYALGRTLEPTDDATLTAIVERMGREGHTMRSLISGIVRSESFVTK